MPMHIPVLQKEVLEYLDPKPNENFIDGTLGEAGHSLAILERNGPRGKVLGIELDPELYKELKEKSRGWHLGKRLILVNDSYTNLKKIVKGEDFKNVAGILFDLGLSSWHLEKSKRGFSFLKDEPLIMRYDGKIEELTAEKVLNQWSEKEIERILREYGQERFARKIAKEIIKSRKINPIKRTLQLVEIIKKATPSWYHHQRIHFATRTFQALRIAVNEELSNLEKALPQALEILKPKGKLVVISFHSLEDRIVKNFLKKYSPGRIPIPRAEGEIRPLAWKILTKKPIRPTIEEIKINPRSRSAKLRAAQKI